MRSEVPPSYQTPLASNSNSKEFIAKHIPLPNYTLPVNFSIGDRHTEAPLVTVTQLKGHLALLHAFAVLRSQIDALDKNRDHVIPMLPDDKERRWNWFVGFAVERQDIRRFYD